MASADDQATGLAAAQHGVFGRAQLLALGVPSSTIGARLADGRWCAVAKGVYRLGGAVLSHRGAATAAFMLQPQLVLSHSTAASLWRFSGAGTSERTVELTSMTKSAPSGPWHTHHSSSLAASQIRRVGGWRCTSRERTLIDLSTSLDRRPLEQVIDAELSSGRVRIGALVSLFDLIGSGRRGAVQMRSVLDARSAAPASESELERLFLRIITSAELPPPTAQFQAPWLAATKGRVDFAYPAQRLAIELDGRRWHSDPGTFESDRRRDQLTLAAGWRPVRITWIQLTETPGEVIDTLRQLLRRTA